MARKCVGLGRFAQVNKMPRGRGFVADADLVCGKPRAYTYLGKVGNTGQFGAKGGKGGCKMGWRYKYLTKHGKMRTGCRKRNPHLRISAIKREFGDKAIIPVYEVKKRGPRASTILARLGN